MNVSCTKCGKRYVIADEKLVGKTSVKIRCKQCQSLISVAGTAGAVAPGGAAAAMAPFSITASSAQPVHGEKSPWDDEATRAVPAPDLSAAWYAMVNRQQVGPFDLRALADKVKSGDVTLRTYLWKPGMGDWKRASDLPEVSSVFAGVSVGAAGLARPPAEAGKPSPRKAPALQRDVAVANEVPAPGVAKKNGNGSHAAAEASTSLEAAFQPRGEPEPEQEQPRRATRSMGFPKAAPVPAPEPAKPVTSAKSPVPAKAPATARAPAPALAQQPLDDLFADVPQPSAPDLAPVDAAAADPAQEKPRSGQYDPFSALGPPSDGELPPPGEATKFFIAQAGVNKRNPPWKIALFLLGFIGLPVATLYLLSSLHIVPLTVERTTESGEKVKEDFFSAGGMSGLKDLLSGEAKRKAAEAEKKRKEAEAAKARALAAAGKGGQPPAPDEPVKPKQPDPSLAAFYQEDDGRTAKVPKNRMEPAGNAQVATGGLADEVAMKVVTERQKAFNDCIDKAVMRNPNLAVGNIEIVLVVGSSGTVKSASVEPPKHAGSDWAQCMMSVGKRMVFPASDGETDVRVPFKVGVAVVP